MIGYDEKLAKHFANIISDYDWLQTHELGRWLARITREYYAETPYKKEISNDK